MNTGMHISQAAQELGVTPQHLRTLERQGRIPPPRRDFNGRVYTPIEIALLKNLGIGRHPARLKTLDEALGSAT